ncbi:hypothetical protein PRZ48_014339 [Zasmidium cellare]|uniref:Uncharacterized protein n=1 Tax=Zasmidium cellare TaxID=395010 RepID=A0ABR0E1E1_ZASCE|nr:hypothetical protein PRZ48_014339 [Zasmidium cellare]
MTCIHYSEHVQPYREGESWTDPPSPSQTEDPAQTLMRIATQVAALKADARAHFADPEMAFDGEHRLDLMSRIDELDSRLLEWQRKLPDAWQSHRVTINEYHGRRADRKTWKGVVYVHKNAHISAHVTTFHVLRLHVSAMRLRVLDSLEMDEKSATSTYDCLYCLQQLADIICACVAPAIEDIVPRDKVPSGIKADNISRAVSSASG